ncbi:MAG: hypothetical protein AABZ47_16005 [Planctomycetota bacterium]
MFTVNRNPSREEVRKFGKAMLFGFGVLATLLWAVPAWRSGESVWSWRSATNQWVSLAFESVGILLFLLSLWAHDAAKKVYVGWMTATVPIGVVMSTVLLSLLYFVLLPPFSLIVRMSDPIRKNLRREGTYWEKYKPYEPTLERMRRPF